MLGYRISNLLQLFASRIYLSNIYIYIYIAYTSIFYFILWFFILYHPYVFRYIAVFIFFTSSQGGLYLKFQNWNKHFAISSLNFYIILLICYDSLAGIVICRFLSDGTLKMCESTNGEITWLWPVLQHVVIASSRDCRLWSDTSRVGSVAHSRYGRFCCDCQIADGRWHFRVSWLQRTADRSREGCNSVRWTWLGMRLDRK